MEGTNDNSIEENPTEGVQDEAGRQPVTNSVGCLQVYTAASGHTVFAFLGARIVNRRREPMATNWCQYNTCGLLTPTHMWATGPFVLPRKLGLLQLTGIRIDLGSVNEHSRWRIFDVLKLEHVSSILPWSAGIRRSRDIFSNLWKISLKAIFQKVDNLKVCENANCVMPF